MERNNDNPGTSGFDQGGTTGTGGSFGSTGTGSAGMGAGAGQGSYGTAGSTGGTTGTGEESRFERGKEAVQDRLGTVKEKASHLQASLADKLDAGADKLRQRAQSGTMAGATGGAEMGVATDDRMAKVSDSVATGLTKSADWLRNGDLQGDIERQVRENPGRSLVVALGIGYLLGKAFRR